MSKNLLKCAHFTLQGLEDAKTTRTQTGIEKDYLDYLANYSIGNLVEIVPLRVDPG